MHSNTLAERVKGAMVPQSDRQSLGRAHAKLVPSQRLGLNPTQQLNRVQHGLLAAWPGVALLVQGDRHHAARQFKVQQSALGRTVLPLSQSIFAQRGQARTALDIASLCARQKSRASDSDP